MPTFNSFDNQNKNQSQVVYDFTDKQTKGAFLTKVFGMMFVCLLITTVIAAGFGYGFQALLYHTRVENSAGTLVFNETIVNTLLVVLVVSAIALLIMSFVLPIMFIRGKHNIIVPLILFVTLMGILLSTFTFIFDWVILVEAFGITTLIFGVMGFLGYISKGRLAGIGVILLGLIIGAGLLALINWIMILAGGITEANVTLSWVVSLLVFAFLMLITLYDVNRIKKIAESGATQSNNLVYYCAYILYSDFIALLVRVIYFLAIITGKRR